MRVLVCPTAFKGSFGAAVAADSLARGIRRAAPSAEVREMPLSDGGPGLLDALLAVEPEARVEEVGVSGPLGEPVTARILWTAPGARDAPAASEAGCAGSRDVAVLESADACGLGLVTEGREDALAAHTLGVGELVREALQRGAREVVVGLGGSATTDGGTGMARAFGYGFLDAEGGPLPPGGGPLVRLARILPGRAPAAPITALADVDTPMDGARGAARTFGPQKGATGEELERLVEGLERLSERLGRDLGPPDVGGRTGSGAAGGLGAGMAAFLGADLVRGSDWVLGRTGFREALGRADLLVTGEGAWDPTSDEGKVTGEVLRAAREAGVEALLLCGRVEGVVPEGVAAADGGGRRLDPGGLEELAARAAGARLQGRLGRS